MKDLQGKVVVITGASSGIGKALAMACLAKGAKVAVCARDLQRLQSAFTSFETDRVFCRKADMKEWEDCRAFVEGAYEHFGRIDVLINNAGISMRALFEEVDLQVLRDLMEVNFWGAVYCTRLALPYIRQSGQGAILGISSIAGYRGLPARTGYSASKFALQGFLEALRVELWNSGIDVLWVSPGFTASEIRKKALGPQGSAQGESPLPESKLMTAEEVADHILMALAQKRRSLVLTRQGKLTVWLNKWLPGLADRLVYRHFLKEPDSPLQRPPSNLR